MALVTLRIPITQGLSRIFIRISLLALVGTANTLAMLLLVDLPQGGGLFRPICLAGYSGFIVGWDNQILSEGVNEGIFRWIYSIITCR